MRLEFYIYIVFGLLTDCLSLLLQASGDYEAHGSGRWELTLANEMNPIPAMFPPKMRSIPRSSTSASLANAYERSANTSQFKRPTTVFKPKRWNESTDSINEHSTSSSNTVYSSSTWSNKLASKSKRFYQLMAGNGSTQSLSESISRPIIENGSDGGNHNLIVPPRVSSSTTVNNFAILHQQQQATPSTLQLRAENAHSMAQWAETISRCLGATSRQQASPSSPSMSLPPFHARLPRPRLASVYDETGSFYELPSTSSSLVSAAMASRRKREESNIEVVIRDTSESKMETTLPDPITTKRNFTAADKFIRSKRRASLELFSFALSGRRSNEVESRPTTSSGTSTRSSICCAGEAARMSLERNANRSSISSGGPLPSFVNLASPFATVRRSGHGRNSSVKSNRSSLHLANFHTSTIAPAATTVVASAAAAVSTVMPEYGSFLDLDNSLNLAENLSEQEPSPASSHSLPSPLTPSPQTPSDAVFDNFTTGKHYDFNNGLGLTMMFDSKTDMVEPVAYRPFESQAIIVESPTGEDLATLIAKQEEEEEGEVVELRKISITQAPPRRGAKLSSSPSMPMLNRDFFKAGDEEEAANNNSPFVTSVTSSPLRFATFTKFAARRAGMSPTVNPIQMNKTSTVPVSPPTRVKSPLQRPSTATGIRSSVSKSSLFSRELRASDRGQESSESTTILTKAISSVQLNTCSSSPPKVERILPPAEMIATFDRLRNQNSCSSLRSLINDGSDRPALADLDFNRGRTWSAKQKNATKNGGRPRTSPNPRGGEGTFSLLQQQQELLLAHKFSDPMLKTKEAVGRGGGGGEGGAVTIQWQESQQNIHSLPAPPRLNRKTRLLASPASLTFSPTLQASRFNPRIQ